MLLHTAAPGHPWRDGCAHNEVVLVAHGNVLLSGPVSDTLAQERIALRLRDALGPEHAARYLVEGAAAAFADGAVCIPVASAFVARLMERRFHDLVRRVVADETGRADALVRYVVNETGALPAPARLAQGASTPVRHAPPGQRGRRGHSPDAPEECGFTFAGLVVCAGNALALDAGRRVAGGVADAPAVLCVVGGCGVGKSHLLSAISAAHAARAPEGHVKSVAGEAFVNAFIAACVNKRFERFRAAFRSVDLLVIDDIEALAGKPATQAELVNTMDAVAARGGRIVVSARCEPRALTGLSGAVVSRLAGGLVATLARPGPADLPRLGVALGARRGLVFDAPALHELSAALGACPGVREMQGLVLRIDALHRLHGRERGALVSAGEVRAALGGGTHAGEEHGTRPGDAAPPVRAGAVLALACELTGATEAEVRSRTRAPHVVLARALAVLWCREFTGMSYPEIARELGRPNHSSVITALQRLTREIAEGRSVRRPGGRLAARVDELADHGRQRLRARPVGRRLLA